MVYPNFPFAWFSCPKERKIKAPIISGNNTRGTVGPIRGYQCHYADGGPKRERGDLNRWWWWWWLKCAQCYILCEVIHTFDKWLLHKHIGALCSYTVKSHNYYRPWSAQTPMTFIALTRLFNWDLIIIDPIVLLRIIVMIRFHCTVLFK